MQHVYVRSFALGLIGTYTSRESVSIQLVNARFSSTSVIGWSLNTVLTARPRASDNRGTAHVSAGEVG